VTDLRQPLAHSYLIHLPIGLKHCGHLIEIHINAVPVDVYELTKSNKFKRLIRIDLNCLDDRLDHFQQTSAVAVFGLRGRKVSMVPHFQLSLAVNPQHRRSHPEETVFVVQDFECFEADFKDVEYLSVGDITKLRQPIWYSLGEYRGILDNTANLLRDMVAKVVDPHHILLLHPQLPHLLVFEQFLLILDCDLVLLHRLSLAVFSLPDFAVPVVQHCVVPGLWKHSFR